MVESVAEFFTDAASTDAEVANGLDSVGFILAPDIDDIAFLVLRLFDGCTLLLFLLLLIVFTHINKDVFSAVSGHVIAEIPLRLTS